MKLNIKKRDVIGKKVSVDRKLGHIPAVVYGRHVANPFSITFEKNEFLKVYKEAGASTPITIEGDGIKELALIHDIQVHPVTDMVVHVDFLAVKADEKVRAEIPVKLTGESIVEKNKLGKVELVKDHILVEAFPADLPHDITIDATRIETVNDVVFLKDLDLGSKAKIVENLELPVVTVVVIEEEVEEAKPADASTDAAKAGGDAKTEKK